MFSISSISTTCVYSFKMKQVLYCNAHSRERQLVTIGEFESRRNCFTNRARAECRSINILVPSRICQKLKEKPKPLELPKIKLIDLSIIVIL